MAAATGADHDSYGTLGRFGGAALAVLSAAVITYGLSYGAQRLVGLPDSVSWKRRQDRRSR